MDVRPATATDLPAIREITNHEILTGIAHFGTEPESLEVWQQRFDKQASRYPWLVASAPQATGDEHVIGYAKAGPWKPREAYARTVEIGVYVHCEHRGLGVGSALYSRLFAHLAEAEFHTVLAGVAVPNDASLRLHESMGMTIIGTIPHAGFKQGQWHDVTMLVRHL